MANGTHITLGVFAQEGEATPALAAARRHFENTRLRITAQKESDPRWAEIA